MNANNQEVEEGIRWRKGKKEENEKRGEKGREEDRNEGSN